MARAELPIPPHFLPDLAGRIFRVPYEQRARDARDWATRHHLKPASADSFRIALLAVDVQNTFCLPEFELFVSGRSGQAAVEDTRRLCEFVYHNVDAITQVIATLDTHQAMQIFHAIYLVNERGEHPSPYTRVSAEDIASGRWRFNPEIADTLNVDVNDARQHLLHYVKTLQRAGKYELSVWPYHSMLGGIGHALVPAFEEAVFFHTIARYSQADFRIKGRNPSTEHYSVLGPEVTTDFRGREISRKDYDLIDTLWSFDAVVIAGQAKSHCVTWTVEDLMDAANGDERLLHKIYLLEDCASSVVVPGVVDYTEQADAGYSRFAEAGMHVVRSTDPIQSWPGLDAARKAD
jgi:nicotinamidase-related amidase